jgi:predicted  nucleic acid-binding Zn-ribbon protein
VTWKERLAAQEKRHREAQTGTSDVQKAYIELQEELDTALVSLRNLESQRTNSHQEAARRLEEIEQLKDQSQTQGEELDALRHEVEARRKAHVRGFQIS